MLTSFVIVTNEVSNRSFVGTAPSLAKKTFWQVGIFWKLKIISAETYVANFVPTLQTKQVRVGMSAILKTISWHYFATNQSEWPYGWSTL